MSDTPLVLLHGWGMSPRIWNGLRICLSPRIVATPVLPGHYGSASPGTTLHAWSNAVLATLPQRCVLVGWSLGAMIALDLAARHPERIEQLVLFGASPKFVAAQDWPHGLDADTVRGFNDGFAQDAAATLRRFLALQALGEAQRRGVTHSLGRAVATPDEFNPAALADGLTVLAISDLRALTAQLRVPTLLIHGHDDAVMPLAAAHWLENALPAARLEVLEGAGHAPMVSQPELCASFIEEALRG
ncbi:MAG: alpha/beta fold hydrolase [Pseudazoarcus pumilus]|nr:alpha/beta fold hydrolase [Pseudazoarcus pumilus]